VLKQTWFSLVALFPFSLSFLGGCVPQPENSVVVYSAADREYAQPILDSFERKSAGIEVLAQFDVESTKTVGLAKRIESESELPRADLFWNNEIMHTLALEKKGLLKSISWDIPSGWPKDMRSGSGNWVGIAARARVIIVNRNLLPSQEERPSSVLELADSKWQKKCGLARPLFGTTATHFTVLIDQLGDKKSQEFFQAVSQNAQDNWHGG
jgi:iron(III) transport system substrate-binding protein